MLAYIYDVQGKDKRAAHHKQMIANIDEELINKGAS